MANYYFVNTAADGDWGNPNNWDVGTLGAGPNATIPTFADNVFMRASITQDTTVTGACNNFIVSLPNLTLNIYISPNGNFTVDSAADYFTVNALGYIDCMGAMNWNADYGSNYGVLNPETCHFNGDGITNHADVYGSLILNGTNCICYGSCGGVVYVNAPITHTGDSPLGYSNAVQIDAAVNWDANMDVVGLSMGSWYFNTSGSLYLTFSASNTSFQSCALTPSLGSSSRPFISLQGENTQLDTNCTTQNIDLGFDGTYSANYSLYVDDTNAYFGGFGSENWGSINSGTCQFAGTNAANWGNVIVSHTEFTGDNSLHYGYITGNATFSGYISGMSSGATVDGNAFFTGDGSYQSAIVTGSSYFDGLGSGFTNFDDYAAGPCYFRSTSHAALKLDSGGVLWFAKRQGFESALEYASVNGFTFLSSSCPASRLKFAWHDILGAGLL